MERRHCRCRWLVKPVLQMGYRLIPFDPAALEQATQARNSVTPLSGSRRFAQAINAAFGPFGRYFQGMGGQPAITTGYKP